MSIQRKQINAVKAEAKRLLQRIDEMERCVGWHRYVDGRNQATSNPHPDDIFDGGQHAAAVKRASLDLSRAMVWIRR